MLQTTGLPASPVSCSIQRLHTPYSVSIPPSLILETRSMCPLQTTRPTIIKTHVPPLSSESIFHLLALIKHLPQRHSFPHNPLTHI